MPRATICSRPSTLTLRFSCSAASAFARAASVVGVMSLDGVSWSVRAALTASAITPARSAGGAVVGLGADDQLLAARPGADHRGRPPCSDRNGKRRGSCPRRAPRRSARRSRHRGEEVPGEIAGAQLAGSLRGERRRRREHARRRSRRACQARPAASAGRRRVQARASGTRAWPRPSRAAPGVPARRRSRPRRRRRRGCRFPASAELRCSYGSPCVREHTDAPRLQFEAAVHRSEGERSDVENSDPRCCPHADRQARGRTRDVDAPTLGGAAIAGALERAQVAPDQVEHVVMGTVLQAGQGQIPSRQAQCEAGMPMAVSSETINKVCASGMRAIALSTWGSARATSSLAWPAAWSRCRGRHTCSKADASVCAGRRHGARRDVARRARERMDR